jgi:molecular chaperone Hsp33
VVSALTSETCREAATRHEASPSPSIALARTTSSALLLATLTKGDERVTVQILGDGPLRGLTACATDAGEVRAYPSVPHVAGVPGSGRARLGPLVGVGVVNVIRDLGLKERYQGATALVSGEIDEDVERYLTESEQVVSALSADAILAADGQVAAAGGVLVQCLPGGDVATVERARERLRGGTVFAALSGGVSDARALALAALDLEIDVLDVRPVRFHCPCTLERVTAALALCGETELRDMQRTNAGAEVTCNFCNRRYALSIADLEVLIRGIARA